jgi:DNA modification methylase
VQFETISLLDLIPHELNDKLYATSSPDDELVSSIAKHGLLEPVVVSIDKKIISGHRRIRALEILKIATVKVRVLPPLQPHELEEQLIEHNRYRQKTASELVREVRHLQAILGKGQGSRTDLTSAKVDGSKREDTRSKISKRLGVSTGNISKLLFVEERQPQLLREIDEGIISTHQAFLHARKIERERGYEEIKKAKINIRSEGEDWRIIQGDSRTIELEQESVQTIICSPPYWALRDYKADEQIGRERSESDFLENLFSVFSNLRPALKADGCLFVELGDAAFENTYTGTLEKFCLGMIERGWFLRERIAVTRQNWASHRKKTWAPSWSVMYFFSNSSEYKFDRDKIRRQHGGEELPRVHIYHRRSGVIGSPAFPSEKGKPASNIIKTRSEKWISRLEKQTGVKVMHPAPFSRDVVVEPILATTDEGDVVLDCFSGTGTTGVAAIQLDRRYLGIEVNPVYADASRLRLEAEKKELEQNLCSSSQG